MEQMKAKADLGTKNKVANEQKRPLKNNDFFVLSRAEKNNVAQPVLTRN
jgi:hypothetical protein